MKTPYQLPDVPSHLLRTNRQQLLCADVSQPQAELGSRYCHGSYILAWQVGEQLLTSAPKMAFDPGIGCGMPWVFERGLGRDRIENGESFLRLGCGQLSKRPEDWTQSRGDGFQARAWETSCYQHSLLQRLQDRHRLADTKNTEIGYDLSIRTELIDDGDQLGFDQHWSLQIDCPWAEPVVGFPHPFGCHGNTTTAVHWQNKQIAVPPEGIFGTHAIAQPEALCIQYVTDGAPRWTCATTYAIDKVVLYASDQAVSAEPYLVRCPANGQEIQWSVQYRASLSL